MVQSSWLDNDLNGYLASWCQRVVAEAREARDVQTCCLERCVPRGHVELASVPQARINAPLQTAQRTRSKTRCPMINVKSVIWFAYGKIKIKIDPKESICRNSHYFCFVVVSKWGCIRTGACKCSVLLCVMLNMEEGSADERVAVCTRSRPKVGSRSAHPWR